MANQKEAQIQMMETKANSLRSTADDMRKKADSHREVVTGINTATDSDWITRYLNKFNEVVSRIDVAAGEVEKTAGTLDKIRTELVAEDTREL